MTSANASSRFDKNLEEISNLRDSGRLTEQQFEVAKRVLLDRAAAVSEAAPQVGSDEPSLMSPAVVPGETTPGERGPDGPLRCPSGHGNPESNTYCLECGEEIPNRPPEPNDLVHDLVMAVLIGVAVMLMVLVMAA